MLVLLAQANVNDSELLWDQLGGLIVFTVCAGLCLAAR